MWTLIQDDVRAIVGEKGIQLILECRGGEQVRIPSRRTQANWLAELFGIEVATQISKAVCTGGISLQLTLPTKRRFKTQREVLRLSAEGLSSNEITRKLKITRRHVFRIRAPLKGPTGDISIAALKRGMVATCLLDGFAFEEVCKETGCSMDLVRKVHAELVSQGKLKC